MTSDTTQTQSAPRKRTMSILDKGQVYPYAAYWDPQTSSLAAHLRDRCPDRETVQALMRRNNMQHVLERADEEMRSSDLVKAANAYSKVKSLEKYHGSKETMYADAVAAGIELVTLQSKCSHEYPHIKYSFDEEEYNGKRLIPAGSEMVTCYNCGKVVSRTF